MPSTTALGSFRREPRLLPLPYKQRQRNRSHISTQHQDVVFGGFANERFVVTPDNRAIAVTVGDRSTISMNHFMRF